MPHATIESGADEQMVRFDRHLTFGCVPQHGPFKDPRGPFKGPRGPSKGSSTGNPGGRETFQKDGGLRPSPFCKVSQAPGAAQTPEIDDFRSVKKSCIPWHTVQLVSFFVLRPQHKNETQKNTHRRPNRINDQEGQVYGKAPGKTSARLPNPGGPQPRTGCKKVRLPNNNKQ